MWIACVGSTNGADHSCVFISPYEDEEIDGGDVAADPECDWESMRSMSSSSLTPHVSTTQIRQLVTGNARTLLQVTHLNTNVQEDLGIVIKESLFDVCALSLPVCVTVVL